VTLTVVDNCGNTSTSTATVTVTDPNPPSISINDIEVNESVGNAALTVILSTARACDVSFTVNTANNTALAPNDYTTVSSTVYTIPGGSTTVTVYVPITDDKIAEPTETFVVKLSNPINSLIADDQGIVTIVDNDSPPNVIIGDASAAEGKVLNFPVSLSNISSLDITVTLGFANVTTSDGDFVTTPVTVSFPAGTTTATASVQSISDYIQESNETFIVKVTGTTGPVGNTSDTGTGTILDDDQKPIANDDNLTTDEDIVLQGNSNVNDFPNMKPGDIWTILTQPTHGKATMNPDGTFIYTPNANYNGSDSFTYKLCDTDGDCDDATVFISMKPVDDFPVANDDTFNAHMDGVLDDFVDDNDIPSGDGGNVWSIVKQPTTGTVLFNPDGSFTYTPNVGYLGNDSFTYKLCDVDGDCDEAVVNIVVDDIIPNQIFTPNGDTQNDTYYVKNIEFYPGSRITIFNRWGNKVYQKSGYLNDWDGYSNVSKVGSKPLPVGTYYYVIDYGVNRRKILINFETHDKY
jgi:gliding motility-associated-like protein